MYRFTAIIFILISVLSQKCLGREWQPQVKFNVDTLLSINVYYNGADNDTTILVPEYQFDNSLNGYFIERLMDSLSVADCLSWRFIQRSGIKNNCFFEIKSEYLKTPKWDKLNGVIFSCNGKINGIKSITQSDLKKAGLNPTGNIIRLNIHCSDSLIIDECDTNGFYCLIETNDFTYPTVHYLYNWWNNYESWDKQMQSKFEWIIEPQTNINFLYNTDNSQPFITEKNLNYMSDENAIEHIYNSIKFKNKYFFR